MTPTTHCDGSTILFSIERNMPVSTRSIAKAAHLRGPRRRGRPRKSRRQSILSRLRRRSLHPWWRPPSRAFLPVPVPFLQPAWSVFLRELLWRVLAGEQLTLRVRLQRRAVAFMDANLVRLQQRAAAFIDANLVRRSIACLATAPFASKEIHLQ